MNELKNFFIATQRFLNWIDTIRANNAVDGYTNKQFNILIGNLNNLKSETKDLNKNKNLFSMIKRRNVKQNFHTIGKQTKRAITVFHNINSGFFYINHEGVNTYSNFQNSFKILHKKVNTLLTKPSVDNNVKLSASELASVEIAMAKEWLNDLKYSHTDLTNINAKTVANAFYKITGKHIKVVVKHLMNYYPL